MSRLVGPFRWAALIAGAAIALSLALLLLGAHIHALPFLSPLGSLFLNWFAPWFVLLPLVAAALLWWGGPSRRRGLRRGLGAFALAVAAVGAVAVGRMVAAAQAHAGPVNLLAALASHAPLPSPADHQSVYSTFDGKPLRLVLYRPRPGPAAAPVLLYLHGGGWVEGDRFAGAENMRWFARRGWLTVAIDYPLSSKERHLWDRTIDQVGCALAWTRVNAARFGGDPGRISLLGDSAGGNLALIAGYSARAGRLASACGGAVPRVAAVAAVYPAVHLGEVYRNDFPWTGEMVRGFADAYLGGPPERFPQRYAAVNPAGHMARGAPPTLVIVGENDHLLPPGHAYRFADEAARAGVETKLVRFPYGEHLFDQATGSIGNQLVRGATARFLEAQGQGPR